MSISTIPTKRYRVTLTTVNGFQHTSIVYETDDARDAERRCIEIQEERQIAQPREVGYLQVLDSLPQWHCCYMLFYAYRVLGATPVETLNEVTTG